jgi:hypothetical protein
MIRNHSQQSQSGRIMVGAAVCLLLVLMGCPARAHLEEIPEARPASLSSLQGVSSPEESGLQAACWALTIPYGAAKMAYAIGGGIVGGLAWVITGGDTEVAKSVWYPSMTGDYIVRPKQLTGDEPLRFVGVWTGDPPY